MESDSKYLRQLEARIRTLETENEALRAALQDKSAPSQKVPDDTGLTKTANNDSPAGQLTSHNDQIQTESITLKPEAKIRLFRTRFAGREDLYARRWENRDGSKNGYAPVCSNEWRDGICKKPDIRCHECSHRAFESVTDAVMREHLTGVQVVGLYALDSTGRCRFVVADFDHESWRDDTRALVRACRRLDISVLTEISRSGDGAHVWFFFDSPVLAIAARRLATALIERTCREERLLSLSSHDRLIPNQDSLTGAGFGSLVALPLQKSAREREASIFVDDELVPFADQWKALEEISLIGAESLQMLIERAEDGHGSSALNDAEADKTPWRRTGCRGEAVSLSPEELPADLTITLADGIYVERLNLPQPLIYAIARLAAFANPHWHELERVHRSTWKIARYVDKSQLLPMYLRLPRGCTDTVLELLGRYQIELKVQDERISGTSLQVSFTGELLPEQKTALTVLTGHDTGVLHAPPGFGKTVTAAAVIAQRARSTIVIVHTTALLRQWRERLAEFLSIDTSEVGTFGGGRKRQLTGKLDVAGVRSLANLDDEDLARVLNQYGQVIVDECHHAGAATHTRVLEAVCSRYVLGLTATPKRRDGLEPIVFMHCGPVRHHIAVSAFTPIDRVLEQLQWSAIPDAPAEAEIQDILSAVAGDLARTAMLADAAVRAWRQGRKVLILTERRGHIDALIEAISQVSDGLVPEPIVLHGKLTGRARRKAMDHLSSLADTEPRCIIATGRLIGEGFDHPALDTVVFAMPFAWRGTLQQYLGRLARASLGKRDIRVIDVHDTGNPMLESMWRKRMRGYRALGWREQTEPQLF
ncbi:DEAD/DEAH box helicase [Granulosicoccus sp.]|nr:DEAD/DEAH box helicase [Granulosicoccus sp.]